MVCGAAVKAASPVLLAGEDVDGGAELVALDLLDLAGGDEAAEVGVGVGGGVEFSGGLLEVRDEFGGVFEVGDGAAGGAGDAADEALGAALAEHFAGGGVVGVDDDAIGNVAAEFGVGVGRGVEEFGVDAADAFFGVTGLDGGVAVFGDADSAHSEEAGWGLGVVEAEAAFAGAAADGFVDATGFAIDDVHALGGGVDDVEPGGVVVGVAGGALGGDGGLDGGPVLAEEFLGRGGAGGAGGTGGCEKDETKEEALEAGHGEKLTAEGRWEKGEVGRGDGLS